MIKHKGGNPEIWLAIFFLIFFIIKQNIMVVSTCEARATRSGSSFHPSSREKAAHRSSNDFTWRFGGRVFLLGFLKGLYIVFFFIGGFTSFLLFLFYQRFFIWALRPSAPPTTSPGSFVVGFLLGFLLKVFILFFYWRFLYRFFLLEVFMMLFLLFFFIGAFSFEFQDLVLLQRLHLEVLANISGGFVGFGWKWVFWHLVKYDQDVSFTRCIVCLGQDLVFFSQPRRCFPCFDFPCQIWKDYFSPRWNRCPCVFVFVCLSSRICDRDISYQGALYVFGESWAWG